MERLLQTLVQRFLTHELKYMAISPARASLASTLHIANSVRMFRDAESRGKVSERGKERRGCTASHTSDLHRFTPRGSTHRSS
jgi:hypothetical protein